MKVCIYGAGAVGCYLAARLYKGGADMSVVARGANLDAISRRGIHLETPDYAISAQVKASDRSEELGLQDFVVVSVKSPSLPSIVEGIKPLLGPDTTVAFVMNGLPWWYFHSHSGVFEGRQLEKLDPGGRLWDAVDPARVVGGVIFCTCDLEKPGVVRSEARSPKVFLGEPSGETTLRIEQLAALLRGDTLQVDVVPEIRTAIWVKLQANICAGLIGCLSNSAPKDVYGAPACADAVRRIATEVGAIAKAVGCEIKVDAEEIVKRGLGQNHRPSILQDLQNGRPMEIDTMFGIPLEMGKMAGVETPTLDLMVALVKARARTAGAYDG